MASQRVLLHNNFMAIKLAMDVLEGKNELNQEQTQQILNQFSGWGGIKALMFPIDKPWSQLENIAKKDLEIEQEVKDFYQFINKNFPQNAQTIIQDIRAGILTSFYTPKEIPSQIFKSIKKQTPNINNFLDPCAGNGVYTDACLAEYPNAQVVVVDKDYISALILKAKYASLENVKVIHSPLEQVQFKDQKFDVIASNIPFGNFKIYDESVPEMYRDKIHNYFFFKCQDLLKEGGFMSLITSQGVFNSRSNAPIRKYLSQNGAIQNIITLPQDTFSESNIKIGSHLINYTKKGYLTQQEKEINQLAEQVITNAEGITLNEYIDKYPMFSFSQKPTIFKNQFGDEEYGVKSEENIKAFLEKVMYIPEIVTVEEVDLTGQKLNFDSYPSKPIFDLSEKDPLEHTYLKNKNIIEDYDHWEVAGALKGNYRGNKVPICTFFKVEEKGKIYYYQENHIHEDTFRNHHINERVLTAEFFVAKTRNYLQALERLSLKQNMPVSIDFRRNDTGKRFFDFINKSYQNPILNTHYLKESELDIVYHRQAVIGDYNVNPNGEIALITDIFPSEQDGEMVFKLEQVSLTNKEKILDLLHIYSGFNILQKYSRSNDGENLIFFLNRFNQRYDRFVARYGYLNNLLLNDSEKAIAGNYLPILKSFEVGQELDLFTKGYQKATIFNLEYYKEKKIVLSPYDAVVKSLVDKGGKFDLDYVLKLTGIESKSELLNHLKEVLVYNPIEQEYQLREHFLAGNLYDKIDFIKNLQSTEETEQALTLLESALPQRIFFDAISINAGARWLDKKYLLDYSKKYFNLSSLRLKYFENNDMLVINADKQDNLKRAVKLNNGRYLYPTSIVEYAFYDIYPQVKIEGEVDLQSTYFVKKEVDKFKKGFVQYLKGLPEKEKNDIENNYNYIYNSEAKISYESKLLNFEDVQIQNMNITNIRQFQKDAVWKTILNRGGVVDHEVGFGKTLSMLISSYYMKKLGIAKKPILTALPTNVSEIAITYKKLFPEAKVLYASKNDYEPKTREIFLNKIRMNDWDLVIMSHNQFEMIPQDEHVLLEILKEELEDLENNILQLEKGVDKDALKRLELKKQNLEAKILQQQELLKVNKDVLSFDKLGIDHITIDESHHYKNLMFQTQHSQVAGIGNTSGAKKCNALLSAIRSIQKRTGKDMGASFFSGTPVSNSLTELYIIHKYLTPNLLERKKIKNFDAWASVFAGKSAEFEVNIVNKVQSKERFRYFNNLPELSSMYGQIAHVKYGDNDAVDRPEKNEFFIINEQSPLQQRFNSKLIEFMNTGQQDVLDLEVPLKTDDEKNAPLSLLATTLSFKASLDMRLINSKYPDEPRSKVNQLVDKLHQYYRDFDQQKGTQIVFCEMGVPKKKYSIEELEENYNNNVFTSIYDDIRLKLVKRGVKDEEIAFIQNYSSDKQKAELSRKMNEGKIRFLIGNTTNAGTGLNVQKKLIHIAHLTIPWKPSEIVQRNGRGHRAGNIICKEHNDNKIDISFSVTKQTLDEYRIDLNKTKNNFIMQIRQETNQRSADEGDLDDKLGMNLAELQALLSGDNTLLNLNKAEKRLKELQEDEKFVQAQNQMLQSQIDKADKRKEHLEYIVGILDKDFKKYQDNVITDKKNVRVNDFTFFELPKEPEQLYTQEQVVSFLQEKQAQVKKMENNTQVLLGEMYGFKIYMSNSFLSGVQVYLQNEENKNKISYMYGEGILDFKHPGEVHRYFLECFNTVGRRLKSNQNELDKVQKEIEALKSREVLVFDKGDEILEIEKEIETLRYRLATAKEEEATKRYKTVFNEQVQKDIIKVETAADLELCLREDEFIKNNSTVQAMYCADQDIFSLVEILNETSDNMEILNVKQAQGMDFVTFEIKNADLLYVDFMNAKERIIEEVKHKKGMRL